MPCQNHPNILDGLAPCWRCRREFCPSCTVELQHFNFCAECKHAQVRDLLAGTDMLSMDLASLDRRFGARVIDAVLQFMITFFFAQIGRVLIESATVIHPGSPSGMIMLLGVSLVGYSAGTCYEALMMVMTNGQTLGKLAVKIRVVTAEGNPITARQAWWRSILKFAFFCVGFECSIGIMIDGVFALGVERASLHDLGAQTRVVNCD